MDDLSGKVAVVTGGASGIGLAFVRRFAAEGMSVVLADVEVDALDAAEKLVADEIGADRVLAVRTDVRDSASVLALAAATFERFGTAHVICNNAGVATGGLSWTIEPERWKWLVDVNLLGVAYGISAFVPRLVDQGEGHVVNTASAAGLLTGPGMAPYFATKHAVVALSESLLFDLQLSGSPVGVTVLCPEWVNTRISESERNLPPEIAGMAESDDPSTTFMRETILGMVSGGTDPADIATLVCDAVKNDTFYVLPHDTTLPIAKQRWATIEAGEKPAMGQLPS